MVKVIVGYLSLVIGGLLGCPLRLNLNRGKLADRDIGVNEAWSACPSRFENDRSKRVKLFVMLVLIIY